MVLTQEEKRRVFEEEKIRKQMQGKSVVVSVIFSFIIAGLGDLYCGSWIKALIFFALDIICLVITLITFGIGSFLYAPVWICGLILAWLSAKKSEKKALIKTERSLA